MPTSKIYPPHLDIRKPAKIFDTFLGCSDKKVPLDVVGILQHKINELLFSLFETHKKSIHLIKRQIACHGMLSKDD